MILRTRLRLDWPLCISIRRAVGNELSSLQYVPGTALRGALAEEYLAANERRADAGFETLFLNGRIRFGDLRIDGADPWPLSARVCREVESHAPRDLLLAAAPEAPHRQIKPVCPQCDAKRVYPGGYFKLHAGSPPEYQTVMVESRRAAHVQILPELLRAQEGQFHTARVLERGQDFEGAIWADDAAGAALLAFAGPERILYLGRGRTRGQGRVRLRLSNARPRTVREIQEALGSVQAAAARVLPGKAVFICTLLSRSILYDRWLLARPVMETADIDPQLGNYTMTTHFNRLGEVAGWHANAQLPKTGALAVEAGSSFLFVSNDDFPDLAAEHRRVAPLLQAAEERGIGERRAEGFGEVRFCHPFHSDRAEGI
jgi:CRISPR-associated protein Csx10